MYLLPCSLHHLSIDFATNWQDHLRWIFLVVFFPLRFYYYFFFKLKYSKGANVSFSILSKFYILFLTFWICIGNKSVRYLIKIVIFLCKIETYSLYSPFLCIKIFGESVFLAKRAFYIFSFLFFPPELLVFNTFYLF